jgi:hypothetical protein
MAKVIKKSEVKVGPDGKAHSIRRSRAQWVRDQDAVGVEARRALKGKDVGKRSALWIAAKQAHGAGKYEEALKLLEQAEAIAPLTVKEKKAAGATR